MIESIVLGGVRLDVGPWDFEEITGWFDTPGVTLESVSRLGDGDFLSRGRFRNRVVRLTGVLHSDSCVDQQAERDRVAGLFHDGGLVSLTVDHGGLILSTDVRLADEFSLVPVTDQVADFDVLLTAVSPWLYSGWRESILRPVGAGVGLVFPLFAPDAVLSFGSAVSDDVVVWNNGNAVSFPQFVVTADAPGGFTVSLGGARVSYPYPCFASSPVVVDMAGSVVAGGGDVSDRVTAVWGGVGPKETLQPGFELLSGGSGFCVVRHRDTYV